MRSKHVRYDWKKIQKDYDSGLSQKDISEKYGITMAGLYQASKRGELKCRTVSKAIKLKIEQGWKPGGHTKQTELQRREKISKAAKKNKFGNYGGYKQGSGRGRKSWYVSKFAGKVWLDSSYELRYVKSLDSLGVRWKRNSQRFPYQWEGKIRYYIPDFYLFDGDKFIEIKGYITEKDKAKWNSFPHKLEVLLENDIKKLETQANG